MQISKQRSLERERELTLAAHVNEDAMLENVPTDEHLRRVAEQAVLRAFSDADVYERPARQSKTNRVPWAYHVLLRGSVDGADAHRV